MKSVRIHSYGNSDEMRMEEVARPRIGNGEVLVKILAAGVNPVDWKIRSGQLKDSMPHSFPLTMGQDMAGEVTERGRNVNRFKIGDSIFGFASGSYAEYAAARSGEIALKPKSIDFVTAASMPTAGLTAWQALIDIAQISPGQLVLIHGAGGGVGSFAVQIARWKGAHIVATAAAADGPYLKSLGVEQVIDYKSERFADRAGHPDIVIDLVGGETLHRSYGIVKKGGIIVTTVFQADEAKAKAAGVRAVNMVMRRDGFQLAQIAQIVDQGIIKPRVDKVLPIDQARQAHDLNQSGKAHGKVVLRVA